MRVGGLSYTRPIVVGSHSAEKSQATWLIALQTSLVVGITWVVVEQFGSENP
jgi:hypothetical protein